MAYFHTPAPNLLQNFTKRNEWCLLFFFPNGTCKYEKLWYNFSPKLWVLQTSCVRIWNQITANNSNFLLCYRNVSDPRYKRVCSWQQYVEIYILVVWFITSWDVVRDHQCFGGTSASHFQGTALYHNTDYIVNLHLRENLKSRTNVGQIVNQMALLDPGMLSQIWWTTININTKNFLILLVSQEL